MTEPSDTDRKIEQLRTLIDQVPVWLAMVDRDLRYVVANQKYADAFGKPVSEIEGRFYGDVFPFMVARHQPLVEACLAGQTVPFDAVLAPDGGGTLRLHGVYRPLRDDQGAVVGLTAVAMDMTAELEAQEALQETEERLRIIADNMRETVALRDRDLRVLYRNRAFDELVGGDLDPSDTVPTDFLDRVHPDDRERFVAWMKESFQRGEPADIRIRFTPLGRSQQWLWARANPVPGDDGRPRMWLTSTLDVTAWKEAEDALAAEKERLSVTLGSIGEAVIASDTRGRIVELNEVAERMTGWTRGESLGMPLSLVFRLVDGIPQPAGRRTLFSRDGREVLVEFEAKPIRDAAGQVLGEVIVARDATESLRREDERIQAQKLESLALLAGGLAHDFNNLLTGILGNLSLALSGRDLPEDLRRWLQEAQAAGGRAQALTQQLVTFARGGAPVRRVVDLRKTLRDTASFSRLGSNVACRILVDADLWPAEVDEGQIAQVVQNLVINGVEAMTQGGELVVQAENRTLGDGNPQQLPPGPYLLVRVSDRGVGIPPEIRARIFDPYFSTKQRRSGLGLAISHSIVSRHGGSIGVLSEVGRGTSFEIFLPACPGRHPSGLTPSQQMAAVTGSILVMDDDPSIRRLADEALGVLGFRVTTASDGREACDLYRKAMESGTRYQAVILDLTVPGGMGGLAALQEIRALDPGVRAIVTSGYSEDPVMARYREHGFVGVLPKPFTLDRLGEVLIVAMKA